MTKRDMEIEKIQKRIIQYGKYYRFKKYIEVDKVIALLNELKDFPRLQQKDS